MRARLRGERARGVLGRRAVEHVDAGVEETAIGAGLVDSEAPPPVMPNVPTSIAPSEEVACAVTSKRTRACERTVSLLLLHETVLAGSDLVKQLHADGVGATTEIAVTWRPLDIEPENAIGLPPAVASPVFLTSTRNVVVPPGATVLFVCATTRQAGAAALASPGSAVRRSSTRPPIRCQRRRRSTIGRGRVRRVNPMEPTDLTEPSSPRADCGSRVSSDA
jgi:hypothetical protein